MSGNNDFRFGIAVGLEDLPARQPVVLRGDIAHVAETAAGIGYDGLELHIRNPAGYDGARLRAEAEKRKLAFAGIATGMEYTRNNLSLIAEDETARHAAVARLREHMDLAAILDCPVVIGIMRSNIPDFEQYERYEGYLRDSLLRLDEYADKTGVPLVFEAITRYINNYLNTLKETADFLASLGSKYIALHIDTHSMNIEDVDFAESIAYCGNRIGYVHYSDSNRWYPGGGHVDFPGIHQALRKINYHGYITVESLPEPDQVTCAVRGFEYMRTL